MASVTDLAHEWLRIDRNPITRQEIEDLLRAGAEAELGRRLLGRIKFGTAGLRARMEAGFTCMNSVTVIQASQGLAAYVLEWDPVAAREKGIVIGRDARYNSEAFAQLAAAAFASKGVRVLWFDKLVHTPLVPFAVRALGAAAGVMVTASHNPPQDNGYKVYWSNGCQIIPPHDAGIAAAIEENLEPVAWELDRRHPLFNVIDETVEESYYQHIALISHADGTVPPFVYTPMHGVGLPFLKRALQCLAPDQRTEVEMCVVAEQADPDPTFKTVKFPNPEERGALDLAMQTAAERKIDLIIANDPDADRLAVAEYIREPSLVDHTGHWHQFTGNELGILLASHALDLYEADARKGTLAMLCSTVSSGMLPSMAEAEGFHFVETLTGFKWLGNVAQDLIGDGFKVPYAFEEALGYMFSDVVFDKDGVSSAVIFLSAAAKWQKQSSTPYQKLQQLYQKYGYFADANTYLISPSPKVTTQAFEDLRASTTTQGGSLQDARRYPTHLGRKRILRWRDLTNGFDSGAQGNVPELPVDRSAQMITCELEGDVRFTMRGSGTEPKIKFYVEGKASCFEDARVKAAEAQELIVTEWFSPTKYGLVRAV